MILWIVYQLTFSCVMALHIDAESQSNGIGQQSYMAQPIGFRRRATTIKQSVTELDKGMSMTGGVKPTHSCLPFSIINSLYCKMII